MHHIMARRRPALLPHYRGVGWIQQACSLFYHLVAQYSSLLPGFTSIIIGAQAGCSPT